MTRVFPFGDQSVSLLRRRLLRASIAAIAGGLLPAVAWPAEGVPTAQVKVATLQRSTLSKTINTLGTIRIGGWQSLAIVFPRGVEVSRLLVRTGEHVHKGQPLIEVKGAPGTELAYVQAKEAARFATAELARIRQLAGRQLATQSQIDAAAKTLADAKAQLAAADAQHLGQGRTFRAAPFDAIVTAVSASVGTQLAAGSAALEIAPTAHREAVVGVSPDVARQLFAGMPVALRAIFDTDQLATATVISVAGMVDPQSHLVDVTLALGAPAETWLPGIPVEATFSLDPWNGWVVPRQAVLRDASGQPYVFQDDHGKARRVDVSLEIDTAQHSGIAGALKPDLPLVVVGNYELTDGMALEAQR